MIFGFNTDVQAGGTVYHVQSEARIGDLLLQTQVFVKGQCVAKRTASYASLMELGDFTEARMQELLRQQHGEVLEAVRAEQLAQLLPPDTAVADVGGTLALRCLEGTLHGSPARVRIAVSLSGTAVQGAQVTVRGEGAAAPETGESTSGADGIAELRLAAEAGSREAVILVSAHFGDLSATRKFRLRIA